MFRIFMSNYGVFAVMWCMYCKGRGWPRQAIGSMVKNYKEEGFSYKHYRSNEWIHLTNMVILFVLQILQGNCPPPWKSCVWCSICIHILWECHEASRLCVGNKLTRDRIILLHLSFLYQILSFIKILSGILSWARFKKQRKITPDPPPPKKNQVSFTFLFL